MKRYRFKLQTVLDVAQQREKNLRLELVRAQAAETEAREQLAAVTRLHEQWEGRIREQQRGRLDAAGLRAALMALEAVRRQATRAREALRAAEQATEAARQRLTEAAQERKMLERLREKSREDYLTEELAQAVKMTDDLSTVRAAARRAHARPDSAMTGAQL